MRYSTVVKPITAPLRAMTLSQISAPAFCSCSFQTGALAFNRIVSLKRQSSLKLTNLRAGTFQCFQYCHCTQRWQRLAALHHSCVFLVCHPLPVRWEFCMCVESLLLEVCNFALLLKNVKNSI